MDIQERAVEEFKDMSLKVTGTMVSSAKNIAETTTNASKLLIGFLIKLVQDGKVDIDGNGEITLDKMQKIVDKGESLTSVRVGDEDIEFFKDAMQKEGMLYAVLDINNDDCKNVIFLERDADKIKNVITVLQSHTGLRNELAPQVFLNHLNGSNVGIVENVSEIDMELFRQYARDEGLVYASYSKNGNINILCNSKDKKEINKILGKIGWDMTSKYAENIREHYKRKKTDRKLLNEVIENGGEEYYVVDAKNNKNYVEISQRGLSYYKNGKKVFNMSRADEFYFVNRAHEKVESIANAVVLRKSEYECDDRKNIIKSKARVYPDEIAEAIKKSHKHMTDVQRKMSLDDENNNPAQIFDDSIDFSDYANYEKLSDDDRERVEEAVKYDLKFGYKDIALKRRNLDSIIMLAEKQKENSASVPLAKFFEKLFGGTKDYEDVKEH